MAETQELEATATTDVVVDPADPCSTLILYCVVHPSSNSCLSAAEVFEELFKEGKEAFAKRNFVEAERIYRQCVELVHTLPIRLPQSVLDRYKASGTVPKDN